MRKKLILSLMAVAAIAAACCQQGQKRGQAVRNDVPVFLNDTKDIEERVEDALTRMTLEEKIAVLHAQSKFSSAGVPRLGIPEIWTSDGPHGIRPEVLWDEWNQAGWTNDSCTAFPALTALAATWNPEMASLYGKSIGEEARYRKKDVLLGPGVNICRTPLNGRSFEYMGEDPFLSGKMVVPYVKGVQSNGVAACVKHYALNNQEMDRNTTEVSVDDRTLYEIYLPAFKAAVEDGGAWAIMSSYNLYKGLWNCQNKYLLNDVLKGEWKFDGVVISDWGGVHETEGAVNGGLDMEFGTWTNGLSSKAANTYDNYYLADPYLEGIKSGEYDEKGLDEKVRRVLRLAFRTVMDKERPLGSFSSPEHLEAARRIGAESIVLLKNDGGVLPVKSAKKILVVGENAVKMMTVGGGSSSLKVKKEYSPLEGITERFKDTEVMYERGYVGDVGGQYNGVTTGQDLSETRSADQLIADAVAAAKDADYVVFIGGLNKSDHQDAEGEDRESYALPYSQDTVISALSQAAKNLIVVNISGNAVAMPWIDKVPAALQCSYLGSEAGHSLADVLSGDVNPSGKLPYTIGSVLEDYPQRSPEQYPGVLGPERMMGTSKVQIREETYSEGVFVGYRWFEHQSIKPVFPFGYGLSYTTFEYADPKVSGTIAKGLVFTVPVTNTGSLAGSEIVELYVSAPNSTVERPVKELKGFAKVYLEPGETQSVTITIDKAAISYFNAEKHEWVAEKGDYKALIGSSSADILKTVDFSY